MTIELLDDKSVRQSYEADASGVRLLPDFVARPDSVEEVVEVMRRARSDSLPVTCAGAQSSTTAASITDRGILLSLRGLDTVSDIDERGRTIRVGPGAFVADVKRTAATAGLLFAPDPTSEEESTIGGAIACNASGARTYKYGATRRYVQALTVVMANGEVKEFRRPNLEKNTVGYAFAHDPIDWFIGSEGTLGIVVDAELSLLPLPTEVIGLALFFATEEEALRFVIEARENREVSPRCIEYFDNLALEIARQSPTGSALPANANGMVYIEEEVLHDAHVTLGRWAEFVGESSEIEPLVFQGEAKLREARQFRHSIPATMNERGGRHREAGGRKVSTDWAVPYRRLPEAVASARRFSRDAGIAQPVIYGHAGNGHPHQNFIATDSADLSTIEGVVEQTLQQVLSLGGTVAAEHGIGKIKRRWLPLQMNALQIAMMTAVKRELDPQSLLAPGNIL
ncbi:MAG: FAD-binding oxidoreductase [Gemmatimonadaceae bacterium]